MADALAKLRRKTAWKRTNMSNYLRSNAANLRLYNMHKGARPGHANLDDDNICLREAAGSSNAAASHLERLYLWRWR